MENVPAIISPINKPHYQKWLDFLDSLGYSSYNEILNASDYGVAQNRERMFCVSLLGQYNYNIVDFANRACFLHQVSPISHVPLDFLQLTA